MSSTRRTRALTLALVATVLAALLAALPGTSAVAYPPGLPSKAQAQSQLNALTVRAETSMSGYSRDRFPHWTSSNGCTVRQQVLKRDGKNVRVNSSCQPTSGSWFSEYDGVTRTDVSRVSIDHVVPLAEAWRSGASSWSDTKRRSFANDVTRPQLIAVTTEVNSSKGDRDPAAWKPPLQSKWCAYSKFWIRTKHHWGLAVQSSEKSALQSMLNRCSY